MDEAFGDEDGDIEDEDEEMEEDDEEDDDDEAGPGRAGSQPAGSQATSATGKAPSKKSRDEKKISCLPCREAKVSRKHTEKGEKVATNLVQIVHRSNVPSQGELSSVNVVSAQEKIAFSRHTNAADGQAKCASSRPIVDGSRQSKSSKISRRLRQNSGTTRP